MMSTANAPRCHILEPFIQPKSDRMEPEPCTDRFATSEELDNADALEQKSGDGFRNQVEEAVCMGQTRN